MVNTAKRIIGFLLSAGKAFFNALVTIVWGLSGFFLLMALLTYYKQDPTTIASILPIIVFIRTNWGIFFFAMFAYEFIINYKEFIVKTEEVEDWTVKKVDKKDKEAKL